MLMTVLSMSVVTAPNAGAAASAGDLIKMDGLSTVYYLAADGKRYVFPNEATYFSWYRDFSAVVTVSQGELETYPLGSNVTIRPGTWMVKITTDPKVYAIEPGGDLLHVESMAAAETLYGADWIHRIVDVPDYFFNNYTVTGESLDGTAYPAGSLIKSATGADVYYIDADGKARKIASGVAFEANRFDWADIIVSTLAIPTAGTDIVAAEEALGDTSSGAGGVANAGTGLTVALASTSAGSSTLVTGQALANLATFNFAASSDGAVKVTSVKVKRVGIGLDTTLPAVYLYNGTDRLTDEATVSSTYVTWNNSAGIFTIPAGGSVSITVKSNIAANTAGQTVGIQVEAGSDISTDGATVSGSFPVNGNLHSIASGTLAAVDITSGTTPATNTALDPQDEFGLWGNYNVTVGTRSVTLNSVRFRQIGSIESKDLKNFKLLIDGAQVGDTVASLDANGNVTFDLSASPKSLTAATHTFKVIVDVVGGSSRTTSLSLRKAVDISVTDSELNVPILVTVGSSSFSAQTSGTQTISTGTLTVTKKTNSASGNVTKGASAVTLATYEFKASGEAVKVETLRANAIVSNGAINKLRNGKILANGVQVGSTADLYAADGTGGYYTEYSLGSSLVVNPGSPVEVAIVADIYDNDGTDSVTAGNTFQAQIASSTSNAQRQTALTYLSVPGSDTAGNTLTVSTGSLTCSRSSGYTNKATIDPQTAFKLAEFTCTAGATEAVNITSFNVDFDNSTGVGASTLSDVYIVYGDTTGSAKSTVASTTNAWTVSKSLAKNGQIVVSVFGNILAAAGTGDTYQADLTVSATSVDSAAAANATEATGQTITIGTASLTTAAKNTPLSQVVFGGQEVEVANYDVSALNEGYTVKEVAVKFNEAAVRDAISMVKFYNGSTLLGQQTVNASGYATSTLSTTLAVASGETKTITVKLDLNTIGTNFGTSGRNASTTLDTIVAQPSSGGADVYVSNDRQGNNVMVYKSYPIINQTALGSTGITGGVQDIYKFTVAPSSGGPVYLKQMKFTVGWVDAATAGALRLQSFKLKKGTTDITSSVNIVTSTGQSVKTGGTYLTEDMTTGALVINFAGSEEEVNAETTYTIQAQAVNFVSEATGKDSVTINMIGDSAADSTNRFATFNAGTVWQLSSSATAVTGSNYNLIWSDKNLTPHSAASGSASGDWFNGYLIKNLDLDGTTLSI